MNVNRFYMILIPIIMVIFLGCSENEPENLNNSDFVGVWSTINVEASGGFENYGSSNQSPDEIKNSIEDIYKDADFEFLETNEYKINYSDNSDESGEWEFSSNDEKITLTSDSETKILSVVDISNNVLSLNFSTNYFLTDDGVSGTSVTVVYDLELEKN